MCYCPSFYIFLLKAIMFIFITDEVIVYNIDSSFVHNLNVFCSHSIRCNIFTQPVKQANKDSL